LQRPFSTFVGIDLGGARGKTTAVSRLSCAPGPADGEHGKGVLVQEVSTRHGGVDPWHDAVLIDYLGGLGQGTVVAVNAPLTVPACVRCQLAACPGKQACEDPAVVWLRTEGAELVDQAIESDRDRIVAIPGGHSGHGAHGGHGGHSGSASRRALSRPPRSKPRVEPYVHRGSEIILHYERGLLPRDSLGAGVGPISARGAHLRRVLAAMGFELNRNLIEVSPRATVHALFGARQARGYKRNADPWESRVAIIDALEDMRFAKQSRLAREEVLRNDHCFEALLSSYTAYLWARDGWALPDELFTTDGWIWTPPG
jgi:predicted nuclease with RNAse H fold